MPFIDSKLQCQCPKKRGILSKQSLERLCVNTGKARELSDGWL